MAVAVEVPLPFLGAVVVVVPVAFFGSVVVMVAVPVPVPFFSGRASPFSSSLVAVAVEVPFPIFKDGGDGCGCCSVPFFF